VSVASGSNVGEAVAVFVGVSVNIGSGVTVSVLVALAVGVSLGVGGGGIVGVSVCVGAGEGVSVGVSVGMNVAVRVGSGVGVSWARAFSESRKVIMTNTNQRSCLTCIIVLVPAICLNSFRLQQCGHKNKQNYR
jgi:hypothetical protein